MEKGTRKQDAMVLYQFLKDAKPLPARHAAVVCRENIIKLPDVTRAISLGGLLQMNIVAMPTARRIEVGDIFQITLREHAAPIIFLKRERKEVCYLVSRSPGQLPRRW